MEQPNPPTPSIEEQQKDLPGVPTISSDEELLDDLTENDDDETNVDESDETESGAPMKISSGEDA